jgi:hypothetical protein
MSVKEYVGSLYYKGIANKKLLILGESFYCDIDCSKQICNKNKKCINILIKNLRKRAKGICKYQKTYSNISKLFCALLNIKENVFWKKIAYYNYIPYSIGSISKSKPTKYDFVNNYNKFRYIVKKIKPNIIIALGKRLWNNIPDNKDCWTCYKLLGQYNKNINNSIINQTKIEMQLFTEKHIIFFPIYHPSNYYFNRNFNNYKILFQDLL